MNDEVFQRAKEERLLLKIFKNERHSWIGHTIGHDEFVVNILEGAISGKKAVGRPGLLYLKQVSRNTAADSYRAMKRMACSKARWKIANHSKDGGIIRIYRFFKLSTNTEIFVLLCKVSQGFAPCRDVQLTGYEVECCQYNVEKNGSKAVEKTRQSSYFYVTVKGDRATIVTVEKQ